MKPIKVINNYVYVVLQHHTAHTDAKLLGVYINREEAEGKAAKVTKANKKSEGYISVLKKSVEGRQRYGLKALVTK